MAMRLPQLGSMLWIATALMAIDCASDSAAGEAHSESSGSRSHFQRRALSAIAAVLDEKILTDNVFEVRDRAAIMPDAERFEYLSRWVLPSESHATFRMNGAFTQTDPAPVTLNPALRDGVSGGSLVSPVFDLLNAAKQTHRLRELRGRVTAVETHFNESQQRSQLALLVLIHLELGDQQAADDSSAVLQSLMSQARPDSLHDQWPEILVAYYGVNRFPNAESVGDLVTFLATQRIRPGIPKASDDTWQLHVIALAQQYDYGRLNKQETSPNASGTLTNWIPVSRSQQQSRGTGNPQATWHWNGTECRHNAGHDDDYLFFQSPLRGDFEVEMDASASGTTQFIAADRICGIRWTKSDIDIGSFRNSTAAEQVDPAFSKLDLWVRYRFVFRNGVQTIYINGRPVHTQRLSGTHDPWIGVRSWYRNHAIVRDVRISGNPRIPEVVRLSASKELPGWYSYHNEPVGGEKAPWQFVEDVEHSNQILGRRLTWLRGTNRESLLRYHRPLVEDGFVEYDFFYKPGEAHTYPALDRLAFVPDPDGVRIHWITDSAFDPTSLPPDNIFPEPHNRRGPETLPLKPDDWNHMKVSLVGKTATLELNGQVVFERELESANRRTFGLFHYAEQTEVRVRDVLMHGSWPTTLPPVSRQQLANSALTSLDTDMAAQRPVFVHDFATAGLPEKYFRRPPATDQSQVVVTAKGVSHSQRSPRLWTQSGITNWFQLHGDFDVSVGFDAFETTNHDNYGCALVVNCGSGHRIQVGRRHLQTPDAHGVVVGWLLPLGNGEFRSNFQSLHSEATGGRLRMVRKSDRWYVLFAEHDSSSYQLVGEQKIEGTAGHSAVFELMSIANDGGSSRVLWKDVRIAAKPLMVISNPLMTPKNGLFVINSDGTQLRQISMEGTDITSPGSPEWSPDGQQIAFDHWTGSSATTNVFVVNADGSGLTKVGKGAMPTFSPDGQRLACSGGGIVIMDTDGSNRTVLTPEGWGAQWSPNGKWIAYESRQRVGNTNAANISIIDVVTNEIRTLLDGDQAHRYSQIYWNMEWSPDSRQICFKGSVPGEANEMAITAVLGSSEQFSVITRADVVEDFSWHPDGTRILLAMHSPEHAGHRIFTCNPDIGTITLLASQPMDQKNVSAVWSPDGRRIAFISTPKPKAVLWKPELQ